MVKQVYNTMKEDSKIGDFVDMIKKDIKIVGIQMTEDEIKEESATRWKKNVNDKVKAAAFEFLVSENKQKTKTNIIKFEKLEMSKYLERNRDEQLTKFIFKTRSGTLDIKDWYQWKYENNLCIGCETKAETMDHFMSCSAYNVEKKSEQTVNWKGIYENDIEKQSIIAKEVKRRFVLRQSLLEAGQDSSPGSQLQTFC